MTEWVLPAMGVCVLLLGIEVGLVVWERWRWRRRRQRMWDNVAARIDNDPESE